MPGRYDSRRVQTDSQMRSRGWRCYRRHWSTSSRPEARKPAVGTSHLKLAALARVLVGMAAARAARRGSLPARTSGTAHYQGTSLVGSAQREGQLSGRHRWRVSGRTEPRTNRVASDGNSAKNKWRRLWAYCIRVASDVKASKLGGIGEPLIPLIIVAVAQTASARRRCAPGRRLQVRTPSILGRFGRALDRDVPVATSRSNRTSGHSSWCTMGNPKSRAQSCFSNHAPNRVCFCHLGSPT